MNVAVVIPVFNRFEHLPRLLDQLTQQSVRPSRVVIVDHGTQSLTLDRKWPLVIDILKRDSSLWFAAATNEGLIHARLSNPDFLMMLNDDVEIGCERWLERLLEIASAPEAIAASTAIDHKQQVIYAGVTFKPMLFRYAFCDRGRSYDAIKKAPTECDVLPTRGIVFRSSVLDRVGLLDDQALPHHSSDYEWTARAKQKGFRLLMARDVYLVTTRAEVVRPEAFISEINDYFRNRNLKGSFPVARAYSARVFHQPYRACFLAVHCTRFLLKCIGRRMASASSP